MCTMDERGTFDLWKDGATTPQSQGEGQLRTTLHTKRRNENDHHADSHVAEDRRTQEALPTYAAAKKLRLNAYATEQATRHWEDSAVFTRVDTLGDE
jgi:hypothetical protein